MMALMEEIPGAMERPSGCRIVVRTLENGETTITIPPRSAPSIVIIAAAILFINLLLVLYTGGMLLIAHKSVLLMTQITPHGLPISMRHYEAYYLFGLIFIETVGFLALASVLRPIFTQETLTLGRNGIRYRRQMLGHVQEQSILPSDMRGFHLQRDPQGITPSALTLHGRGQSIALAETLREAEREWLASIGNVLLRRL